MNFKENESVTKLRGGYYTPENIARFLTKWVLFKKPKKILEPSCGDGQFIKSFSGQHRHKIKLTGVELNKKEAKKAEKVCRTMKMLDATVINVDFLDWSIKKLNGDEHFDSVLGNPPYIRYQYLEKKDQELSEEIFSRFNLSFTKHTNAWVPFIISSVSLLIPGGRLAMVVPSEILHVLHAKSLRSFLLSECDRILMIDPTELLFEDALQGTVLLMLEKKESRMSESKGVSVVSAPDNSFLEKNPENIFLSSQYVSGDVLNGKWMKVLLAKDELEAFEKIRKNKFIKRFSDIATVDVGIVTGANKFFLVDDDTVKKYELDSYSRPMFGRSEHCPGIIYDKRQHKNNKKKGLATNFLLFDDSPFKELPKKVKEYIKFGESQKLHTRYKCRIRKPWYVVPSIYKTEIGMLKRAHHFPRLLLNTAGAYTTDTAYRIKSYSNKPDKLVYCFINSLTALTAELEGRHYGGGVLELVPSEIEKLLIPIPDFAEFDLKTLNAKVSAAANVDSLLIEQDDVILKAAGITKKQREIIHQAWRRIRSRRHRMLGA